jgi:hypothetical protein
MFRTCPSDESVRYTNVHQTKAKPLKFVGALQLEEQNSKHINHNKHENKERNAEPKQRENAIGGKKRKHKGFWLHS